MDEKWENRPEGPLPKKVDPGYAYEVIDLELARKPQTILAYEMNGEEWSIEHGRSLRLRVESRLGYKMIKWISAIEFIGDFRDIGWGKVAGATTCSTTIRPMQVSERNRPEMTICRYLEPADVPPAVSRCPFWLFVRGVGRGSPVARHAAMTSAAWQARCFR